MTLKERQKVVCDVPRFRGLSILFHLVPVSKLTAIYHQTLVKTRLVTPRIKRDKLVPRMARIKRINLPV